MRRLTRHRPRRIRPPAPVLCLALLGVPSLCAGQGIGLAVRGGVVVSSALAEDRVANPALAAALGGGIGAVRAVPAPGIMATVVATLPMKARTRLDFALGGSHATLEARDDAGTRTIQTVNAGHATVSVRYLASTRASGSCGFGLIRYFAERRALFAGGTEVSPLVECGARVDVAGPAGRRLFVRAGGQLHRFRTPVLIDAGAQAGTVYRLAIEAGIDFGGDRS